MADLHETAAARAAVLGLPTTALEDWRYVDVKPLAATLSSGSANVQARSGAETPTVCDGRFVDQRFGTALDAEHIAAERTRIADESEAPACWSWSGEVRLLTVRGQQRVRIDHHATTGASGWRLLIELAPGAELDLIIVHRSQPGTRSSVGIVATLAANAHLRVSEIVAESAGQLLVHVAAQVARDARLSWTSASNGGELVRFRHAIDLTGSNAEAHLAAIDQLDQRHQAHRLVRVQHRTGHTVSRQVFKTVARDTAIASFDGLVRIAAGADGSDAGQLSRNLLLSPTARIDTRPQLDIAADEVKANHGATIGQLDAEEMFYLRTRGLPETTARTALLAGFADEVLALLDSDIRPVRSG